MYFALKPSHLALTILLNPLDFQPSIEIPPKSFVSQK
jgi:hypothetical protein